MRKFILLFCILSTPAFAGSAILNLSGTNNVLNLAQLADQNIMFSAPSTTNQNNTYSITQEGGNHTASVDIEGNFQNYTFSLTQSSLQDSSISITQTCNQPVCTPSGPYIFNQY